MKTRYLLLLGLMLSLVVVLSCGRNQPQQVVSTDDDDDEQTQPGPTIVGRGMASVSVSAACFSPDGRYILTGYTRAGGQGSTTSPPYLALWDAQSGKKLRAWRAHRDLVSYVAFLPDSQHAISSSRDGTIKLWNVESGKKVRDVTRDQHVYCLLSHDGTFVTYLGQGKLKMADVRTREVIRTFDGVGVMSVSMSPNDKWLLTSDSRDAFQTPILRLLDINKGTTHKSFFEKEGWDQAWKGIGAFTPDSTAVVSVKHEDDKAFLVFWNLEMGKILRRFEGEAKDPVVISADGQFVFALGELVADRQFIAKWDLATGKQLLTFPIDTTEHEMLNVIALSPDGRRMFSSAGGTAGPFIMKLRIWDTDKGELLMELKDNTAP